MGKVGKDSNILISHFKKKWKILSLFFLPHFCFLSPPALLFTFPQLLELFALPFLQLENLPKHGEKKFNNEHLPKPSDLNPQRPPKCHSVVKVSSLALIFHVLLHAQHRHHGQMSVIPKISVEGWHHSVQAGDEADDREL